MTMWDGLGSTNLWRDHKTVPPHAALGASIGHVVVSVARQAMDGNDALVLRFADGSRMVLHHEQDCCESVGILDVAGDLDDLTGVPLLEAAERAGEREDDEWGDHITWTFYRFATIKGSVVVCWRGESNGYYSEGVDCTLLVPGEMHEELDGGDGV